jgi:mono/diheme cytochrome c family protein
MPTRPAVEVGLEPAPLVRLPERDTAVSGSNLSPRWFSYLVLIAAWFGCNGLSAQPGEASPPIPALPARVVAVGVADPAALRALATFLPDGAGRNDAALAAVAVPAGTLALGRAASALLRRPPAEGGAEVLAIVEADGSIVQVRAGKRLDALAPADTVALVTAPAAINPGAARALTGIVFNWVPDPILYIADPRRNAVVVLTLIEDDGAFRVAGVKRLNAPELNIPVDLAPAVLESINPTFSSNTTLAGGADFYVANRGDGTIARMGQDGTVLAVRSIQVAGLGVLGTGRLNGIAVAPDAKRIWASISGRLPEATALEGAILEVPAFGPDFVAVRAPATNGAGLTAAAAAAPGTDVALDMGLGPAFNGRSCADCHVSPVAGGMGAQGLAIVLRVGQLNEQGYDPLFGRGGPVARMHTVAELGIACAVRPGVPLGANLISVRNAPPLFGLGLVDQIPDATILAGATAKPNGIHGRANLIDTADGHQAVGRFGWKAAVPRLEQFVAGALRDEQGITNPFAPRDLSTDAATQADCGAHRSEPKDDGTLVNSMTAFVRSLRPLPPRMSIPAGRKIFLKTGCAACHTPTLAAGNRALPLYSDLLLHDMGPTLDDGVVQGQARGRDWRTTPLWGLSVRARFLHDGRAHSIEAAILAHGGEADPIVKAFRTLDPNQRSALLAFLSSL